ncbi:hypothetical protein O181_100292 [Austropuccinia psidii MF-1]|uniref:Uncharacterized protein n=1 Tax=Austropuccinia psidii MF-1 TaxID=1389203 RepID=A0A9Q3JDX9_9BASI|nr:hypothetical protein [Austropuccinia psidii MF-1]
MNQQSTSDIPPLPEDTVERQYSEESEEEDQTVQIKSITKQMQDLLVTQSKNKVKIREKTSYTPGASPSEPTLPRNVRPEDSPISPTPGPRATSTPATEPRSQNITRRAFVTTPNNPSPLQQKFPRQERPVVKIKAKYYKLNFDGEELKKFIKKVERIAQIEGATDEDLPMQMTLQTANQKVSYAIEAMPGYEEGNWTQLKKDVIKKWGRVQPERRYRKDLLMKLCSETQEDGGIGSISQYNKLMGEYETIVTYLSRYRYIPQDNMFHEDSFDCLSADIKGAISKEMIKDNVMIRAEDAGYLIPPMKILKKYIEQ